MAPHSLRIVGARTVGVSRADMSDHVKRPQVSEEIPAFIPIRGRTLIWWPFHFRFFFFGKKFL
jgi:hypothetical protein